jgi:molecular chaperone DnaK (HSP70)
MPGRWAMDLGTTNTVVAVEEQGSVRAVHLPQVTRTLPAERSPLIPSAVHVAQYRARRFLFFHRTLRSVHIGQEALNRNADGRSPAFAEGFKRVLAAEPHRAMLRPDERTVLSAREAIRLFLRELLAMLKRECGEAPRDLTIPAPVGYYEPYRAELQSLLKPLGIRRFRSLDEPVAAALGYGVNVAREETLLVVDFGGGTLDLAAVRLGRDTAETGKAVILAKHMAPLGGNDVDRWLVEHFVGPELADVQEWDRDLLWNAMWAKERLVRHPHAEFRWRGRPYHLAFNDLVQLLSRRGLYDQVRTALHEIQAQLAESATPVHVDQVLLVGGSTLLPGVAAVVDEEFPQAVVRHDPEYLFTSVALGAARFAAGTPVDDFVYHDYALAVQNERSHGVEYELLVPRRTRYPTASDFTVRYYADYPGMTEVRFSVCEVGRLGQAAVGWERRPNASSYWAPADEAQRALVIELNPMDEAVPLRPVGQGASARLRVIYRVNEDRWLCVTVEDLVRKETLRADEPVIRLR